MIPNNIPKALTKISSGLSVRFFQRFFQEFLYEIFPILQGFLRKLFRIVFQAFLREFSQVCFEKCSRIFFENIFRNCLERSTSKFCQKFIWKVCVGWVRLEHINSGMLLSQSWVNQSEKLDFLYFCIRSSFEIIPKISLRKEFRTGT